MKETIKKNIFIYTRGLTKDYDWVCEPLNINGKNLLSKIEETYSDLNKDSVFTSEWYSIKLKSNNQVVYRIVIDGRKDQYSRFIRRYEGSIIPNMTHENILLLEQCLLETQKETNNYGYGFENFSQVNINNTKNANTKLENCTIEIAEGRVTIKSDILSEFLKENTYADLLNLLQVEENNIGKLRKY